LAKCKGKKEEKVESFFFLFWFARTELEMKLAEKEEEIGKN